VRTNVLRLAAWLGLGSAKTQMAASGAEVVLIGCGKAVDVCKSALTRRRVSQETTISQS
jgi:hypothetical protein